MKLKWTLLVLVVGLVLSNVSYAQGDLGVNDYLYTLNDQRIKNDDFIEIEDGIAYGSISEFAKRFGVEVTWYDGPKYVVLFRDGVYTTFRMASDRVTINNDDITLPYSTITIDGRVYAPLDYLMTYFDFTYSYDHVMRMLSINSSILTPKPEELLSVRSFTEEDVLWLARIIHSESANGSLDKKTAIANVVLNRVDDPRFPSTIYDVIYQRNQFPPAYKSNFLTRVPSESSFTAARRALMGVNLVGDCLYFNYRPHTQKGLVFYALIEGDYFYTQP